MAFYRFLIIAFSPLILGHILWLAIKNRQNRYFWQRLGFHYAKLPTNGLWFHCASVGEVITLLPLLKNIHSKNKQLKFILTTNTITGGKIIELQNLDYLFHSYMPFDWMSATKRFLSATKPEKLYLMETEIWPNLLTLCNKKNIPAAIINARLSNKTTAANAWVKSLLKNSLSKLTAIYTRSEDNALAYRQLGAPENIIKTIGNLKFTTAINTEHDSAKPAVAIDRDYVLLASSHENEELQIYNTWKQLKRDELLLIAPRHPERSAAIIKQLNCKNIAQRSQQQHITEKTDVYLLDSIGELKTLFANAKLVIMGGSFVPVGGHNILEPASFNKAIITGPYMQNFVDELKLMLDKKAIIQVSSPSELKEQLTALLDNKDYRDDLQNQTAQLSHNVEKILADYTQLVLPPQ